MGAIVNGMNLHYLRAFGATFFTFSDYMRGSIRLSALMHLPSIFVFTHDSIGLGEDGPTHQPIEQLAGLRAMPVLRVVRPAGANETALAWQYAIKSADHPTALVLSRQGIPTWNPSAIPCRRDRPRRVRAPLLVQRARAPGPDPDRDRHRAPHLRPRRRHARGRGDRNAAREHAVHGELRRPGGRRTAIRCSRRRFAPASRSRRRPRSAGIGGSASSAKRSGWRGSARRHRPAPCTSTSASPPTGSPTPAGRPSSARARLEPARTKGPT